MIAEIPPRSGGVLRRRRLASRRDRVWGSLLRSREFVIGSAIVGVWVICAVFGEVIAPHDPYATDPVNAFAAPSGAHWFGTDSLGRDVFSRIIVGARPILTIALLAAVFATVLGTVIGLVMGYFGGVIDETLSRIAEAVMALPNVIMALLALTALGPSESTLILVVGFGFAWVIARTIRAAVLTEADTEYVAAARVRGERAPYIMFGEILPNVARVVTVEFTVRVGFAVFSVASLSFLGFGVQPPSPDWGLQISESYGAIGAGYWWTALFPAVAIASLVVGVYLIADAAQEVLER
jgi:peptide/nickel transport system permease protein